MASIDVTILGAGAFGLGIAWACARRGARVRVVDPGGVGAGASGGVVGALAPHVPEAWNEKKAFQFESLDMGEAFWGEVAEVSGLSPGYARTGRLQPLADAAAVSLAQARAGTARALWQGRYAWEVIAAEGAPWEPQSASGMLVRDDLTARIHPRRACAALAGAIRARGGEIVETAEMQGVVVHATGWQGFDALNTAFGRQVGVGVKGQAALLSYAAPDAPQLFADALHIVPHEDGTVAIGSTTERDFDDPASTDAQLDAVIARARAAFPVLSEAPVIARWAGVRPRARSRAPMLGEHPLHPGQFIANGGFKIGFGMAPKVAEVMADLVLEGRDAIPASFKPGASLPPGQEEAIPRRPDGPQDGQEGASPLGLRPHPRSLRAQ
ncbi:NAD(P)/FAD-dependent oxidoreductase [Mesobacterium pallidum]|uniref:NAD(P)/FAD-dependent oxidoreductase n=1 Tax=Mesobacterium pallidum TaxID=2872037 RepID=UPI001EE396E4|nr:FAD-dependent oxidoreductase [Mesobacterium pallidum]